MSLSFYTPIFKTMMNLCYHFGLLGVEEPLRSLRGLGRNHLRKLLMESINFYGKQRGASQLWLHIKITGKLLENTDAWGGPGWLSQIRDLLLILAPVRSQSHDKIKSRLGLHAQQGVCLRVSPSAPLPARAPSISNK